MVSISRGYLAANVFNDAILRRYLNVIIILDIEVLTG
jgi:hypothetical protein